MEAEARALVASGLRGLGEKRLAALQQELLVELCRLVAGGCDADAEKGVMVSALLKYKRGGVCKKAARAADEPARPRAASPPPRAPPSPAGDLLVPRYRLRIAAFNSLKLRLEREGLERDWASMGELLSTYDVILLSEVPANLERATQMLALLNEGNTRFSMLASDPSGARGEAGEKNEVHVAYIRAGLRVVARHTHRWMDGVAMAYAPFTVLLADPNLELGPLFAVTSVHMPPEGRRDDRDKQIDRFLKTYESEARVNLNVPFTDAGAADAKHKACVHIVAGDWNATLGNSEYRARARGFDVLFGNRTATTSGRRNFDNFVLSLDARNHFEISASVLQLARPQNSRESAIGLSDHHLIALTLEREA